MTDVVEEVAVSSSAIMCPSPLPEPSNQSSQVSQLSTVIDEDEDSGSDDDDEDYNLFLEGLKRSLDDEVGLQKTISLMKDTLFQTDRYLEDILLDLLDQTPSLTGSVAIEIMQHFTEEEIDESTEDAEELKFDHGDSPDIEGARQHHDTTDVDKAMNPAQPKHARVFKSLADSLMARFRENENLTDLEGCILLHRESLTLLPTSHPLRSGSLNNLAIALSTYFDENGELQDLEECIVLLQEVLTLQPTAPLDRSLSLNNLADALSTRFDEVGNIEDLQKSIDLYREGLELLPTPHPDRVLSLNNLAVALSARFKQKGASHDIEECIDLHRQVLKLRPESDPEYPLTLSNLATALSNRFKQNGYFQDLDESLVLHREAVKLQPHPHPDRLLSLNNLADTLSLSFKHRGNPQDFEECISLHREALTLKPAPHPDYALCLDNLAASLAIRFDREGSPRDLEESIFLHREALKLRPEPHPSRSWSLNNLAADLSTRFEQKGMVDDLEECIHLYREALQLHIIPHLSHSLILSNLAVALSYRFDQKRELQDLEECIDLHRQSLKMRSTQHPDYAASLNNLATVLSTRFSHTKELQDLEECIHLHRQALKLRPAHHPDYPSLLSNLAVALSHRFDEKEERADLEECIDLHQKALNLRPVPHPSRFISLTNLATGLSTRFKKKGESQDIEQSLYYHESASTYATGSVVARLGACKSWAACAQDHHYLSSALDAHRHAIELLPQLASLDLTLRQRQAVLEHGRELVGEAARCAIDAGQLELAVIFLSTGRSVFWSQALQLRAPTEDLAAIDPILAEKYTNIINQLEQASHHPAEHISPSLSRRPFDPADFTSLSDLVDGCRQTIEDIRNIPGFEGFLLPPSFQSLSSAAQGGPIVLLNASKLGCDALIMSPDSGVQHLPLSSIQFQWVVAITKYMSLAREVRLSDSQNAQAAENELSEGSAPRDIVREKSEGLDQAGFRFVLEHIWVHVVDPILKVVALEKNGHPKRIWWCPSGPFSFLPIHAAGIYSAENEPIDCLFQYAVSSYCTSPQDLLHPLPEMSQEFGMVAIIEPEAPGAEPLWGVSQELLNIRRHIPGQGQLLERIGSMDAPNLIDKVLPEICKSSIVHFGCHGSQNLDNPLESSLLLSGGKLTMAKIIKECQGSNLALAYLSACETATGDENRPDGSLNLVATMMFAGFRSVVGTMWSILDKDAPIVADVFYGHLFRKGKEAPPDAKDAAYALHLATKKLREDGASFSSWVPYVHYGI